MTPIELIDTTLRDGNQSLWGATALTTAMMAEIAPVMDRVGYSAIDFTTSTHMAVAVRFHQENPWERIRRIAKAMPNTPLSFLTTGMRFISWETASSDLMELAFRLLVNAGIRRFAVMDPSNDTDAMIQIAKLAKRTGVTTIVGALTYTVSPFHDDARFAAAAHELASSNKFDRLYIKDPGGLLTPERARTLVPAVKAVMGAMPLELHSHCNIGLAPLTYLAASACGIAAVHVAARAAANGTSQPSARQVTANLRGMGCSVAIDDDALQEVDAFFDALVAAEGIAPGVPQEFDASYFRHQMPGGMLGTMRRQLSEMRASHLLGRVLEETEQVRAELGYPIMVTPFSQIVGTQAVMNVVSGERYSRVPDEVVRYVAGRFGKPPSPIDANLKDRILSSPRAKELLTAPDAPSLSDLRKTFSPDLSDEEFVLRATMPAEQIDAMIARGPAATSYNPSSRPLLALLRGLAGQTDANRVFVQHKDTTIELLRHRAA